MYCGQTVGWTEIKLGMPVSLGTGHIVLDGEGTQLPFSKGAEPCQFSAHICCGQMAGWIKMPLGREVGLSQSDIVLHGDPAYPSLKVGAEPLLHFRPMSIVAKRLYQSKCHLVWM